MTRARSTRSTCSYYDITGSTCLCYGSVHVNTCRYLYTLSSTDRSMKSRLGMASLGMRTLLPVPL